jgi:hypothetical protein
LPPSLQAAILLSTAALANIGQEIVHFIIGDANTFGQYQAHIVFVVVAPTMTGAYVAMHMTVLCDVLGGKNDLDWLPTHVLPVNPT